MGQVNRLTFGDKGTWSLKYNLIWDQLLELEVFPREIAQREVAWYMGKQNRYGTPLESRAAFTKTDWFV
jgi:hypothetical protein